MKPTPTNERRLAQIKGKEDGLPIRVQFRIKMVIVRIEWKRRCIMPFSELTVQGNLLTLEVRSEITKKRFNAICKDMDRAIAALGRVRLVLVMRHYPSFNSAEDLYEDLAFLRRFDHAIDKVAVVCDRSWKDTWVGIFGLFSGIRMDFFEITQVNELAQWIQSD
jgi:hypothetical protein